MILKDPVVDIICGPDNTIAITNTGEAYGAGGNEYNRLGVQSRANIMTFSKVFRNVGEPIDKISINSKNAIVQTGMTGMLD
jgi:alpha-tubulin suppressor-like RCC1 family protein